LPRNRKENEKISLSFDVNDQSIMFFVFTYLLTSYGYK